VVENGSAPSSPPPPPPPPPPAVRTTRAVDLGADDAGVTEGAFTRRTSPRARDLAAGAKAGAGGGEAVGRNLSSGGTGGGGDGEEEDAGDPFEDAAAELMRRAGDREA
jgi:hypothetical protein